MSLAMYDMIGSNVAEVSKLAIERDAAIAMYCTGSPGIPATPRELKAFPGHSLALIDQGFTGSPVLTANIRDVERGAWHVREAMEHPWDNPDPVIYCAPGPDTDAIAAANWKGGVWLTLHRHKPTDPVPLIPGIRVVAAQYQYNKVFDKSVVYQNYWLYGFSATGHEGRVSLGWAPVQGGVWQLLINGTGESGSGSASYSGTVTSNHQSIPLSPGWYISKVRLQGHTDWSPQRKFKVT